MSLEAGYPASFLEEDMAKGYMLTNGMKIITELDGFGCWEDPCLLIYIDEDKIKLEPLMAYSIDGRATNINQKDIFCEFVPRVKLQGMYEQVRLLELDRRKGIFLEPIVPVKHSKNVLNFKTEKAKTDI
jgi:hypothetical protein